MELLKNLNWRYATKKFDSTKKISQSDLELIKEAIRLSPSAYGLQPYKVLIIENPEIRAKLKSASWEQTQITDASQLIVFCNYSDLSPKKVDELFDLKAEILNKDRNDFSGYISFIKDKIEEKGVEGRNKWAGRQAYIGLTNLLAACAELKIDACPMEGFEPKVYDEILGLNKKGLTTAVIATIGYRSEEDIAQHLTKVRMPKEILFELL